MVDFSTDLFTRLINHRVTDEKARWEDYLTECFAWMLTNDSEFRSAVLGPAGLIYPLEHGALAPSDLSSLSIQTQVVIGRSERVDMEITGVDGFRLLVENKVGSPFDRGQIRRYLRTLGDAPRASLVAIVPRRGDPGLVQGLEHHGFLGIRHWEQVVEVLEQLPPVGDARDAMRASLLALMDQLGLKPIEEIYDVIDQNVAEGVQRAKSVCRVLDEAIKDAAGDNFLSAKAPPVWCNEKGAWSLRAFERPIIQGKGPPPRKVMAHGAALESRFGLFYSPSLSISFLAENSQREAMVGFKLPLYRAFEAWGTAPQEFVQGLLQRGGGLREADVDFIERERADELHERLMQRSLMLMDRLADRLRDDGVISKGSSRTFRGGNEVWLELMPTQVLFGSPVETTALRKRFSDLLTSCWEAFFDVDPLEPLARFVGEAVMPRIGEM